MATGGPEPCASPTLQASRGRRGGGGLPSLGAMAQMGASSGSEGGEAAPRAMPVRKLFGSSAGTFGQQAAAPAGPASRGSSQRSSLHLSSLQPLLLVEEGPAVEEEQQRASAHPAFARLWPHNAPPPPQPPPPPPLPPQQRLKEVQRKKREQPGPQEQRPAAAAQLAAARGHQAQGQRPASPVRTEPPPILDERQRSSATEQQALWFMCILYTIISLFCGSGNVLLSNAFENPPAPPCLHLTYGCPPQPQVVAASAARASAPMSPEAPRVASSPPSELERLREELDAERERSKALNRQLRDAAVSARAEAAAREAAEAEARDEASVMLDALQVQKSALMLRVQEYEARSLRARVAAGSVLGSEAAAAGLSEASLAELRKEIVEQDTLLKGCMSQNEAMGAALRSARAAARERERLLADENRRLASELGALLSEGTREKAVEAKCLRRVLKAESALAAARHDFEHRELELRAQVERWRSSARDAEGMAAASVSAAQSHSERLAAEAIAHFHAAHEAQLEELRQRLEDSENAQQRLQQRLQQQQQQGAVERRAQPAGSAGSNALGRRPWGTGGSAQQPAVKESAGASPDACVAGAAKRPRTAPARRTAAEPEAATLARLQAEAAARDEAHQAELQALRLEATRARAAAEGEATKAMRVVELQRQVEQLREFYGRKLKEAKQRTDDAERELQRIQAARAAKLPAGSAAALQRREESLREREAALAAVAAAAHAAATAQAQAQAMGPPAAAAATATSSRDGGGCEVCRSDSTKAVAAEALRAARAAQEELLHAQRRYEALALEHRTLLEASEARRTNELRLRMASDTNAALLQEAQAEGTAARREAALARSASAVADAAASEAQKQVLELRSLCGDLQRRMDKVPSTASEAYRQLEERASAAEAKIGELERRAQGREQEWRALLAEARRLEASAESARWASLVTQKDVEIGRFRDELDTILGAAQAAHKQLLVQKKKAPAAAVEFVNDDDDTTDSSSASDPEDD